MAEAKEKKDYKLVQRYQRNIETLRSLQPAKLDQTTAHVLQIADEFANTKNEVFLSLHLSLNLSI